jgi:transposase
MNELSIEKTMTIKEIAEILNVSVELITKKVRELYPDKMKTGKTTYLNEIEVTRINLEIKQNPHLVQSYEVKTKLEKNLIVRQAIQFLEEDKLELIERNKILAKENHTKSN